MRNLLPLFLAICSLLFPDLAKAWGGAGHQLIAAGAYQQLSPQLKAQVFEVLKAHPDFAKWTNAYRPNANFDLAAYVFMRSSTWPDEIRRRGNLYDHPNWHFIDYPLKPPAFPFEPDAKPNDNVLYGIAQSELVLSDTNANLEQRAASLSWLVHLVGDEHQPLHCESLFTDAYPNGDKGGNDFYVRPNQAPVRLHGIWDGLLGSSVNPRTQWNYAIELEGKFPRKSLPELNKHRTPNEWSLESRELAIEKGYLHGELKGGTNQDTAANLPEDYTKNAKAVAEHQGALGGYRLADEIQHFLKMDHTVQLLPENTNVAVQVATRKIGVLEAKNYYNEAVIVTGKVVQVTVRPTITLINIDQTGPAAAFSIAIFPENTSKFGDLQWLKDHDVEMSGPIQEYRNKPEMILDSPDQIKIVGANVGNAKRAGQN